MLTRRRAGQRHRWHIKEVTKMYDGMLDNLYPEHSWTFNGKNSITDFGAWSRLEETYRAPERDITRVEIPGRNGELVIDNGRFRNIEIAYNSTWIIDNFAQNFEKLKNFLMQDSNYHRLTDTYHPDYYRMARFTGPIDPSVLLQRAGGFDLVFNCKPQCFLLSGETEQTLTFSGDTAMINNPGAFDARPVYTITGYGDLVVGDAHMLIRQRTGGGQIVIDTQAEEVYNPVTGDNLSDYVVLQYLDYPEIPPGDVTIRKESTITAVTIKGNWWKI